MSRYQRLFEALQQKGEGAFVPFVTLGDPNPADSLAIIEALIEGGADALELGFPFSDPAADGPTIQAANIRALSAGMTPTQCFELLAMVRARHPDLPIGLLLYANLVFAPGIEEFYRRCAEAGVDSVLVADVPVHEAAPFIAAAKAHDVAPIFIAPPNGDDTTLQAVSEAGEGYTYLVSRAGVTGTESAAGMPLEHLLASLKRHNAPPAILGFGIATPEQVKTAIDSGAAGAISGSAVVNLIAEHQHDLPMLCHKLTEFTQSMKAATRKH